MKRWQLFVPLAIFAILAVLLGRGLFLDPTEMPSALIDKPVPQFSLPNLEREGELVTEKSLLGEPYLLNVWATWCVTCRVEHPFLLKLASQGVKVVGINYKDEDQAALQWLDKLGNPYQLNIVDKDGNLGIDLGVFGAPETYFVDATGIIRYKHVGAVVEQNWQSHLAAIYAEL